MLGPFIYKIRPLAHLEMRDIFIDYDNDSKYLGQ